MQKPGQNGNCNRISQRLTYDIANDNLTHIHVPQSLKTIGKQSLTLYVILYSVFQLRTFFAYRQENQSTMHTFMADAECMYQQLISNNRGSRIFTPAMNIAVT